MLDVHQRLAHSNGRQPRPAALVAGFYSALYLCLIFLHFATQIDMAADWADFIRGTDAMGAALLVDAPDDKLLSVLGRLNPGSRSAAKSRRSCARSVWHFLRSRARHGMADASQSYSQFPGTAVPAALRGRSHCRIRPPRSGGAWKAGDGMFRRTADSIIF